MGGELMKKFKGRLTQKEVRQLARELEEEGNVVFLLGETPYEVHTSEEGYMVSKYSSLKEYREEPYPVDEDGGLCTGCSVDAIEFMLPIDEANEDGGKNPFYDISKCDDVDDLCELWELDFFMGNQLKTLLANVGNRHSGTNKLREAKKGVHYADRRLKKESKSVFEPWDEDEEQTLLFTEMYMVLNVKARDKVKKKLLEGV